VTVRGGGKGGRNQEFAFALAQALLARHDLQRDEAEERHWVAASIGTDGIDGPTDAAGAIVDPTTFERAQAAGIADPQRYLDDNDTYAFFDRLGDLVRTGPTTTNVGDIQVVLLGRPH
jgi:hydroxypyruvate reductase